MPDSVRSASPISLLELYIQGEYQRVDQLSALLLCTVHVQELLSSLVIRHRLSQTGSWKRLSSQNCVEQSF